MSDQLQSCRYHWLAIIPITFLIGGCAGTKVLKEPLPQPDNAYLATAADATLDVSLDWVIIRDGPGAWARRADWDEYQLTIANTSDKPITITSMTLINSLNTPAEPNVTFTDLVRASRRTAKQYKKEDIEVRAGLSGAGLFATGTTMFLAGGYVFGSAVVGGIAGTGAASVIGPAAAGAILAAPVLIVGGVVRGVNNIRVNGQILERQALLPIEVDGYSRQSANIFYPITPSPRHLEIRYTDGDSAHTLVVDTHEALKGLHLESLDGENAK